jgi:hypothetical protein
MRKSTRHTLSSADLHYEHWKNLQISGEPEAALHHLRQAMLQDPLQRGMKSEQTQRTVLALNAEGTFQTNLPLWLLLDQTTCLHTLWLPADGSLPPLVLQKMHEIIAETDCIFQCIAEDERLASTIDTADRLARDSGIPVINDGSIIKRLSRTGVHDLIPAHPDIILPKCTRMSSLAKPDMPYPFLLRPVSSHAGWNLSLIQNDADFAKFSVDNQSIKEFYATEFIDFQNKHDNLWRKFRAVFVGNEIFPVHEAIHDQWSIWYYNANMENFQNRRDEEKTYLADIKNIVGKRAMNALEFISENIPLDYFGIDFGVHNDGRLIIFEIETGMIVHNRDENEIFSYKEASVNLIREKIHNLIDKKLTRTDNIYINKK